MMKTNNPARFLVGVELIAASPLLALGVLLGPELLLQPLWPAAILVV
jgi:hypothetical protein